VHLRDDTPPADRIAEASADEDHNTVDTIMDRDTYTQKQITAIGRRSLLIGFLSRAAARQRLKRTNTLLRNLGRPVDLDESQFEDHWNRSVEAVEPLEYDLSDYTITPMPDQSGIRRYLEQLQRTDFFQDRYLSGRGDVRFGLVPIKYLVAHQASVRVDEEHTVPSWEEDPADVLAYALPREREEGLFHRPIQTPDDQFVGVDLISRSPNIKMTGVELTDGASAMEKQITFSIRAPPNLVNVLEVAGRIILNNGYHRIYQLLRSGETHVPAVIRSVADLPEKTEFSTEVLTADRPPVLPDFRTDASVELEWPLTNRSIRIVAQDAEMYR